MKKNCLTAIDQEYKHTHELSFMYYDDYILTCSTLIYRNCDLQSEIVTKTLLQIRFIVCNFLHCNDVFCYGTPFITTLTWTSFHSDTDRLFSYLVLSVFLCYADLDSEIRKHFLPIGITQLREQLQITCLTEKTPNPSVLKFNDLRARLEFYRRFVSIFYKAITQCQIPDQFPQHQ